MTILFYLTLKIMTKLGIKETAIVNCFHYSIVFSISAEHFIYPSDPRGYTDTKIHPTRVIRINQQRIKVIKSISDTDTMHPFDPTETRHTSLRFLLGIQALARTGAAAVPKWTACRRRTLRSPPSIRRPQHPSRRLHRLHPYLLSAIILPPFPVVSPL